MEILLWLLPAALATGLAMLWAGWAGRDRTGRERTEADAARLGAALSKPMPQAARRPERERSTGVAVRPSSQQQTRRSA